MAGLFFLNFFKFYHGFIEFRYIYTYAKDYKKVVIKIVFLMKINDKKRHNATFKDLGLTRKRF